MNPSFKVHRLLLLFCGSYLFLSGCSGPKDVVARFGDDVITLEEFKTAYINVLKQPNVFDSPALRKQFLNELIDRRLLAREAQRLGMSENPQITLRMQAFRDKCLRDEHYSKVIKPRIHTDEAEIRQVYAFMQEKRHLRHLFASTQPAADSLYRFLQQGVPFVELARHVFSDTLLSRNGGDLGWVYWDQLEYDLATTAFSLPVNEFSKPVASNYGYHILQVVDFQKTALISENEYQQGYQKAASLVESKHGEKLANEYITHLMKDKHIEVHPAAMQQVGKALQKILRRQPTYWDRMQEMQLTESEYVALNHSLANLQNQAMVEMDGRTVTVAQFIGALSYIPYGALQSSYKTAWDYAMRNFALTWDAEEKGLSQSPTVLMKTNLFKEYLLQMALRNQIIHNLQISETDLQDHYQRHKTDSYKDAGYRQVAEQVRRDVLEMKKRRALEEYLQKRKKDLAISLDISKIDSYYQEILSQAKP